VDDNDILQNKINVKYGFFESIKLSIVKTYDFTLLTLNFIVKLIKGEVSSKSISGPVGIAGYAADSFKSGYTSFLGLLAMLSISIGILNLLPIPMLDGGHLMYYLVEFIIRRPIPERVQLVFQQVGITFLIFLSFFALYNDLLRIML
jgi:regulator of sigma E protease